MAMSAADQELMELQRAALTQGHAAGLPGGVAASDPDAITTWEARRAAQREAYGQFVAAGPIHIGNSPVFVAGQQVPLEHVIRYNLLEQDLVIRVATPELARAGKTFESEEELFKANPRLGSRAVAAPERHPDALDPRGGAALLDVDGVHGPAPAAQTAKAAPEQAEPEQAARPKPVGARAAATGKDN